MASEAAYAPARRIERRSRASGPAGALVVAALSLAAMALLWSLADLVPAVQQKDVTVLSHFVALDRHPGVHAAAEDLLHLLDPMLMVIWGLALLFFSLARNKPRLGLAAVAVMSLAPLTAEILKPLLAHPHAWLPGVRYVGNASWPSGHATAGTALALSVLLVAPPRLRRPLALGCAGFALAVGAALLIRNWHMPSDVLGGYLVGAFWMALAVAVLRAVDVPRATRGA
jgi:membrane-associated phospholipid phosphatase